MTLKKQFRADLTGVFFSPDELGELREVNGREIMVIEDGEKLMEYRARGIYQGQKLIYVKTVDFDVIPKAGDTLMYGRTKWQVEECKEDAGLLEIILKRWSR